MFFQRLLAMVFCALAGSLVIGWFWLSAREEAALMINPADASYRLSGNFKKESIGLHPNFYRKEKFDDAVAFASGIRREKGIKAVVVPHDVTAADYAAALLSRAAGRKIEKIIIIGPNHQNKGDYPVASSLSSWQTPFGLLKPDQAAVKSLSQCMRTNVSAEIFEDEHSIGALVPFVMRFYPNARIVPIALSSYFDLSGAELLSDWLIKNNHEDSIVIFSIDFSHYLSKEDADKMDAATIGMIEKHDLAGIMALGNDNLDSPGALATALLAAAKAGWKKELVYHTNSFDLSDVKLSQTTSHLCYIFK